MQLTASIVNLKRRDTGTRPPGPLVSAGVFAARDGYGHRATFIDDLGISTNLVTARLFHGFLLFAAASRREARCGTAICQLASPRATLTDVTLPIVASHFVRGGFFMRVRGAGTLSTA